MNNIVWAVACRVVVLLGVAGVWLVPFRQSGLAMLVNIASAIIALMLAPAIAIVDGVNLFDEFRGKREWGGKSWARIRIAWLTIALIHFVAFAVAINMGK